MLCLLFFQCLFRIVASAFRYDPFMWCPEYFGSLFLFFRLFCLFCRCLFPPCVFFLFLIWSLHVVSRIVWKSLFIFLFFFILFYLCLKELFLLFLLFPCVLCCFIWFNYFVYWFAPLSQVSVVQTRILLVLISL